MCKNDPDETERKDIIIVGGCWLDAKRTQLVVGEEDFSIGPDRHHGGVDIKQKKKRKQYILYICAWNTTTSRSIRFMGESGPNKFILERSLKYVCCILYKYIQMIEEISDEHLEEKFNKNKPWSTMENTGNTSTDELTNNTQK